MKKPRRRRGRVDTKLYRRDPFLPPLRHAHADRWFGLEIELVRHLDEEAKYAAARDAGDFDIAGVIAGEAVGLIHDTGSQSRSVLSALPRDDARSVRA